MVSYVDQELSAAGWTRISLLQIAARCGARWTREADVSTVAMATFARSRKAGSSQPHRALDAFAPPNGQRVTGC